MTIAEAIAYALSCSEKTPVTPPLPSNQQVDQISLRTGLRLHPDFREYLLKASNLNIGYLEPVCLNPESAHNNFWTVLEDARQSGVPGDLLPLCEDNGDYYLIGGDGAVRFWSHSGATDESRPDLATWIREIWVEGG